MRYRARRHARLGLGELYPGRLSRCARGADAGPCPRIGVVVVGYNRAYWDRHYVRYPWYSSWRYDPPIVAPRLNSFDRTVECANGTCTATRSTTGIYGGTATHNRTCANGECTATRRVDGPRGNTASRVRNCSRVDQSCSVTRTGPRGNSRTRFFER
ncbi:hypothetical protein LZK73_32810 (plasmid) [Neorhizobium galegae]|nr:hypothetical protein LZK73_32810 [Neorhizobium galegae]